MIELILPAAAGCAALALAAIIDAIARPIHRWFLLRELGIDPDKAHRAWLKHVQMEEDHVVPWPAARPVFRVLRGGKWS